MMKKKNDDTYFLKYGGAGGIEAPSFQVVVKIATCLVNCLYFEIMEQ